MYIGLIGQNGPLDKGHRNMPKDPQDWVRLIDTAINTAVMELPDTIGLMDVVDCVWGLIPLDIAKAHEAYIEAQVEIVLNGGGAR